MLMLDDPLSLSRAVRNTNESVWVVGCGLQADKASTLIDTITYLTFLQKKIKEIEASRDSIDHRCEILENRCKGLRDRNQELVEMISKDQPPGSAIHLNLVHLKLQSMGSI